MPPKRTAWFGPGYYVVKILAHGESFGHASLVPDWHANCNCTPRVRIRAKELHMSLITWLLLGLVAGFIASHLVNHRGEGMVLDVLLGIVGAIVGGWLATLFGVAGLSGLNLYSIVVSIAGAVVFLLIYHVIRRGVIGRRIL